MKKILFICFLFILNSLNAQNYDFETYKRLNELAQSEESLGNYNTAIYYYDSMFTIINFYPYDYFNAFTVAWKLGDSIKANNYLIHAALKGLDVSTWNGDELDAFLATKAGMEYLELKDSLIVEHYKLIDKDYFDSLNKLLESDQQIRDGSQEMKYNDSLNFNALIKLSEEKGFPTFPSTGYGCNYAWILLWHHRGPEFPASMQWKKIIPLIEKEINSGNLDPEFLKMHEDFNLKNGYNNN